MIEFYVLLDLAIIFSCLFIFFWKREQPIIAFCLKGLASISVVCLALVTVNLTGFNEKSILLIIGLLFCLFGDLLLALREIKPEQIQTIQNLGTISFNIAQILFIIVLAMLSNLWSLCGLIFGLLFTIGLMLLKKPLKLEFGKCLIPTIPYSFCLASNFAGSLIYLILNPSVSSCLLLLGFTFFIASDLVLSKIYYSNNQKPITQKINFILYYIAIILLACAFVIL